MLNRFKFARGWALALVPIGVVVGVLVFFFLRVNRLVGEEKRQQEAASRVEVSETRLRAPPTDGLALYLSTSDVRATASLNGLGYLATSGGLVQMDPSGAVQRRYTTLDGLPDNDLTALAVFRGRLFIGTAMRGLLSFDGTSFTSYSFTKPRAVAVRALAAADDHLLIGTMDGGLFEYDGQRFSRTLNSTAGADFKQVTALLPVGPRIYIGTQDLGLYIWREAHIEHIGVSDGLPSPHVTGIAALAGLPSIGEVAVATDFGVVALTDANQLKTISSIPNITSLALSGGRLWAGLFTGGITRLQPEEGSRGPGRQVLASSPSDAAGLPASAPAVVCAAEGRLWALT